MPESKAENKRRSRAMNVELLSLNYQIPACDTHLRTFPAVVGTALDAEIRLDDHYVSKYHCEIDLIDGALRVRDLDSLHGTFVNSAQISESTLHNGDELAIGLQTFLVQIYEEANREISLPPKETHWKQPAKQTHGAASA
jgi:pSer/pThr/pTyr-binding forkhead associated (FHA) protein